jgi:hypothetical protein
MATFSTLATLAASDEFGRLWPAEMANYLSEMANTLSRKLLFFPEVATGGQKMEDACARSKKCARSKAKVKAAFCSMWSKWTRKRSTWTTFSSVGQSIRKSHNGDRKTLWTTGRKSNP